MNRKRLSDNKETSEKQRSNHVQKNIVKILYDKKRNVAFDTEGVVVMSADGALMNIDQGKRMGKLLFFYHRPVLEPVDEQHGKKQLTNKCTVEIRMDLLTMASIAASILEGISAPVEKLEKKQASIHTFVKQEKTESPMYG